MKSVILKELKKTLEKDLIRLETYELVIKAMDIIDTIFGKSISKILFYDYYVDVIRYTIQQDKTTTVIEINYTKGVEIVNGTVFYGAKEVTTFTVLLQMLVDVEL